MHKNADGAAGERIVREIYKKKGKNFEKTLDRMQKR
jgi:hypothetical protein